MRQATGVEPLCQVQRELFAVRSKRAGNEYIVVIWKRVAMVNGVNGVKELALTSEVNVWQLPT